MEILDLHIDSLGRLVLVSSTGETTPGIVPVRCFPFADPRRWIALCDEQGREMACIEQLDDLPEGQRVLVEQELERRELLPRVKRIVSISAGAEPTTWEVDTDHGSTTFTLHSEDDVRRMGRGALIVDDRGIRFFIEDEATLDPNSCKLLRRYL